MSTRVFDYLTIILKISINHSIAIGKIVANSRVISIRFASSAHLFIIQQIFISLVQLGVAYSRKVSNYSHERWRMCLFPFRWKINVFHKKKTVEMCLKSCESSWPILWFLLWCLLVFKFRLTFMSFFLLFVHTECWTSFPKTTWIQWFFSLHRICVIIVAKRGK